MTLVHVDLRTPDGEPAVGVLEWIPTRRRTVAEHIVLPDVVQVALTDGVADVEVDATGVDWAWRVVEGVRRGEVRYVQVPEAAEAEYTDLVDVDPDTLDPAAEPEAAWTVALGDVDDRVADVEGDIATTQDDVTVVDGRVTTLEAAPKLVPVMEPDDPVPGGTMSGDLIYRPDPPTAFELVEETATTFESPSSNDITLAVPAGVQVGDTLVAIVTWQTDSEDVVAPEGWTLRQAPHTNSDYRSTSWYTYAVAAVPTSDQVFTLTGGGRAAGVMARVTGVDANDPLLASGGEGTRDTSTVTVPGTPGSATGLMISATNGQATSGQVPYPLVFSNDLVPFAELQSSSDTGVTRTWLAVAWEVTDVDFAEHTVSTAGAISSAASSVIALKPAP